MSKQQTQELICPFCKIEISVHPASRCLDYWIAEQVLDLSCLHDPPTGILLPVDLQVKPYSTSIAAAWGVLEKLSEDGYSYQVLEHSDPKQGDCLCELWKDFYRWNVNHQPTVPLAISRAAIKASA